MMMMTIMMMLMMMIVAMKIIIMCSVADLVLAGVDILHLISTPFPRVWHTPQDDEQHLDFDVIDNFSRIFRVFISNLMYLMPEKIGCRKK